MSYIQDRNDFIADGMSAFGSYLEEFEPSGGRLDDAMCFVWYVEDQPSMTEPS